MNSSPCGVGGGHSCTKTTTTATKTTTHENGTIIVENRSNSPKHNVQWSTDTIDNENMNRKKSNGIII